MVNTGNEAIYITGKLLVCTEKCFYATVIPYVNTPITPPLHPPEYHHLYNRRHGYIYSVPLSYFAQRRFVRLHLELSLEAQ